MGERLSEKQKVDGSKPSLTTMRNERDKLLFDEGFQFLVGVVLVAFFVLAFFTAWGYKGYLNNQADDKNEKELIEYCLEDNTATEREACVATILRLKGEDPTSLRIEELRNEIKELERAQ